MWRRLLRLAHPDGSGTHDLFVWCQALHEYVAGDGIEDFRTYAEKRAPPQHHPQTQPGDRIDFTDAYEHASFGDLTAHAVSAADEVGEPYASLLRMLRSCYPTEEVSTPLYRAQHTGATYKQLAYVAHLAGMDPRARGRWYRICESVPLSQAHAGHLIKELQARSS